MKCPSCGLINRDNAAFCNQCGFRLKASESAAVIRTDKSPGAGADGSTSPVSLQNGRYQIDQIIGSGGMGRVFRAKDNRMKSTVVVKEMYMPVTVSGETEYLEKRFEEEARLLFRLKHSNLPKVMDFFTENSRMYMVMEFVEGENLKQIIKKLPDGKITFDDFIDWMEQVINILNYIHRLDPPVIHRDIKPANIMLNSRGEIFLVDFGVARSIGELTRTHTQVGTFGFASPEHYSGKFSLASDIYSLGATFHYLLTGDDPQNRDFFDYPPLSDYRNDVPPGIQEIFDKMTERDKNLRYKNIEELKQDFDPFVASYFGRDNRTVPMEGIREADQFVPPPPADMSIYENQPVQKAQDTERMAPETVFQAQQAEYTIPQVYPQAPDPGVVPEYMKSDFIKLDVPVPEIQPAKPVNNKTNIIIFAIIALVGLLMTIPVVIFIPKVLHKAGILKDGGASPTPVVKDQTGLAVNESPKPLSEPVGSASDILKKANDLEASGDHQGALDLFLEASKKDPSSSQAFDGAGYCLLKLGKYDEALVNLNKAIELDPANWLAYLDRGDVNKRLGKNKEALSDYGMVVENSEKYKADGYNSRGIVYMGMKDNDRAYAEFSKAIELNPGFYQAYNNRGFCRSQARDYQAAIEDYNKALRINPNFMLALSNRGFSYYNTGKYKTAIEDFSKAIEIDPNDADSYNGRGVSFQALNSYERAFADFNKAIEIDTNFSGAYLNRGIAYYEKKDYDSAISDYSKAIELNPTNPRPYYNRGLAYAGKGDNNSARSDWQKTVELDKDGDTGKRASKKLEELEEKKP
ncbi:MAG: tetratricopeptide repeat protein [Firmicutes bacterium]|nr:tetratricopeptide repeat protein [Bacillota bacterium]